jgi:nucleosome assembly protein 1-like 1
MKVANISPKAEKEQLEKEVNEAIKKLDVPLRAKAVALNNILLQKKALDSELEKAIQELTLKYEKLGEPLVTKSNEIINGQSVPSDAELENLDVYMSAEEKAGLKMEAEPIKNYWALALKNCDMIAQDIQEKDAEILNYLTKVECKTLEGGNYTLYFHFADNEFFTNKLLTKSFILKEAENPVKSEGTEIEWNEGKNVTKKTIKKKQKNKKNGQQRVVTKEVDDESFFNFFKSVSVENEDLDDLDDEEADYMQERMDIDYDISQVLMDEVIPYSLEYYLGIKMAEDVDGEEGLPIKGGAVVEESDEDEE